VSVARVDALSGFTQKSGQPKNVMGLLKDLPATSPTSKKAERGSRETAENRHRVQLELTERNRSRFPDALANEQIDAAQSS